MTTDNRSPIVPKLRFPEFHASPAWSIKTLGQLLEERKETGFSELLFLLGTDQGGVLPQEMTKRKGMARPNKAKYLRAVPGNIAYNTMRIWEDRSARDGMEGAVNPAYTVCRTNAETDRSFFAYCFRTRSLIEQFRRYSQGLFKNTLHLKHGALKLNRPQYSRRLPSL